MALDPKTEERLREMFGARRCCRCGGPASRLAAGLYLCHEHFLSSGRQAKSGRRKAARPKAPAPAVNGPAAPAEQTLTGP